MSGEGESPGGSAPSVLPTPAQVDRFGRVKALFVQALEVPQSERDSFVVAACGEDSELRDEVFSLLDSERAASSFAETPAAEMLGDQPAASRARPSIAPGTRLGAYEIREFIAAGGMGEVYRARHTVLGREVAIKTLNPECADPLSSRRILREAKHASVLAHRNICTIYELGETQGTPFIAMELVVGRPLNEIVREALPSLGDALVWGIQIADALDLAHSQGIIHRDLKSSNVVVDDAGRPVLLDFGLAKRTVRENSDPSGGDTTVTIGGALAGTLTHMAPEVLNGRPADARSDVWSLGILLYELATGTLPFKGRTPFETTSAILNSRPRPMNRNLPLALRLVIERCLSKEPHARYQRAGEVRDALRTIHRRRAWPLVGRLLVSAWRRRLSLTGVAAAIAVILLLVANRARERWISQVGPPVSTLALLPFENATGDSAAQFYAEGLTVGLIGELGALGGVRIISPASAIRVAATASSTAEAAQKLGADAIVTGRLRQASDRVVVDVRLVEGSHGRVVWSDSYERSAANVLALQADIVRGLAAVVRLSLSPGAHDRLVAVRAVNPEAYEAYLRGRYEYYRRSLESLPQAISHFTRATELDPTYAPAYAALADCYNQMATVMVGGGSPAHYRPRAADAAIRALRIDPYSAEAHATLGYVRHYDWQWDESEREFLRAIELNPSFSLAHVWYANLLMSRGRMDEALDEIRIAHRLDPFSLLVNTNVGWVLQAARRHDEAISQLEYTVALDSTYIQARMRLSGALRAVGRTREADIQAERAVELTNRSSASLAELAHAHLKTGRTREARAILDELLERSKTEYVPTVSLAALSYQLGDTAAAFEWYERAFAERSNWVAYSVHDSVGTPLFEDPRFRALVKRYGLR